MCCVRPQIKLCQHIKPEAALDFQGITVNVGPLKAAVETLVVAGLNVRQAVIVADRLAARRAWVVDDPTAPGQRIQWMAALHGGHVVSPGYIIGNAGAYVSFKKATATRRWLWMSNDFAVAHPVLADIVRSALGTGGSRWSKLPSRDAFLNKIKLSVAKVTRTFYVIALVSEKEKRMDKDGANQMFAYVGC